LIVEDDLVARRGLAELLEDEGYVALTAASGNDAIDLLDDQEVDLVLTDLIMPGLDGFGLVAWLRSQPGTEDLPVILMSALADSPRKVTGLDLGADDYLTKPIDLDELRAKIRALLRRATRSRELAISATHDALTGVRNRRGIDELLQRELSRTDRAVPLTVFLLDIDGFKQINDLQGHGAGDRLLADVARQLCDAVREPDTVGRYGGDEFLVLAPRTPVGAVRPMIERLREAVLPTPVSIGAATAMAGDSVETLVSRADEAMYADKRDRAQRRAAGAQPVHP
jgi:diguanylate cyclase (GGDEF)-like protein